MELSQRFKQRLVLDELFDLTLYKRLQVRATGPLKQMLDELIVVETRHHAFWNTFFQMKLTKLDPYRRFKLFVLMGFCRLFGVAGVYLVLESIEVYGVRKYLRVWEQYREEELGKAVARILKDEFEHEDQIVMQGEGRRIHPERIRDMFFGLNDGLVEILGAVSGFFAAFQNNTSVLVASLMVAVAGSISMGAGAYVAVGSQMEIDDMEEAKRRFLEGGNGPHKKGNPLKSSLVVGSFYVVGALVPVIPVAFGAHTIWYSLAAAAVVMLVVSYLTAIISGMDPRRRIFSNLFIMAAAVLITYGLGNAASSWFGISF